MVSIIVAAYNEELNIRNCINSIKDLKEEIEIIIVDDGSDDHTLSICRDLESNDKRIKVIHQINKGVSAARNAGMNCSSGKWLIFVDADDTILPDNFSKLLRLCNEEFPIIQGCQIYAGQENDDTCEILSIDSKQIQIYALNREKYKSDPIVKPEHRGMVDSVHGVYGKLFRTDFVKHNQLRFSEELTLGEDLLFYIEAAGLCDQIECINLAIYQININPNSSTRRFNARLIEGARIFSVKIYQYYTANMLKCEFYNEMCYQIYFHILVGVVYNLLKKDCPYSLNSKIRTLRMIIHDPIIHQAVASAYKNMSLKRSGIGKIKCGLLRVGMLRALFIILAIADKWVI
ncbi:glycosyltransferase family 2 protein [Ethanoligenens harbinense]|uniref:Glycosyl transferase family 2 n=1 Tax=Ethanoligenens harbinense (strain DSM 18485 / JCM 12961 / CGMCC 1.5033 / YUAN-3) TaxID=663278 RepID=E6U4W7_ETHHY|nr:glycosyltransferase family 2 protein [Ethanoligenens harbinense]ADU27852.1 glycosyl transferase family 2 [Ethanoligenens harbinense YUAN-3]AVQ96875.1 glycosyltransferase family 2 protein [Ethanoligenens harbinense YUAN-3]AYF39537.1 glycosyltransferase family 2 protein [Ethanoligenens harbinense]AYF42362.1 glycosyltransferase family 2 protein [Ethanoligenens harbinense]QCN93115.1 glycosyltransferase family 2 protein [Ethanoligenens harbinense]